MTRTRSRGLSRILPHLLMITAYFVIAVIITYPLIANLTNSFAGFVYGDAYEMAHHVWWFKYALQNGEPLFTQTLLGYPNGIDGVTLWANPLQFFPAWIFAFVMPLPAALNLHILLAMALNGWSMWVLARFLLRDHPTRNWAAFASGASFMLFPVMQGHLGAGHAGLMVQWGVPLVALALFQLRETTRPRQWIIFGAITFIISAAGHSLQVIYALMPITAVFAIALILRRDWRTLTRITLAAGIGAVVLLAFLLPVIQSTLNTPAYTDEGGTVRYSADLLAAITPSFRHPLFGRLDYPSRVLGVNIDEGAAYIGIIPIVLAILAAIKFRPARWWIGLGVVSYVLSLGALLKIFDQPVTFTVDGYQSYISLPFALLTDLPFFNLARSPGRFNFVTALAVAALVAYGSAWVIAKLNNRTARAVITLAITTLIAFEYQTFFPLPLAPAAIPDEIYALRGDTTIRAALDLPADNLIAAKYGMYLQTAHERPLIAGQVSRSTSVNPAMLNILQTTLDPALLDQVGADIVIIHRPHDDGSLDTLANQQLGEPIFQNAELAVYRVSPSTENVDTIALDTPTATTYTIDVYTPSPAFAELAFADDSALTGAVFRVDDVPVTNVPDGERLDAIPFWLPASGYYRLAIEANPPCPPQFDPSLRCRLRVPAAAPTFIPSGEETLTQPITFEGGIALYGADAAVENRTVTVRLAWRFDQPITLYDRRFIHVIDANDQVVWQRDTTPTPIDTGDPVTGWHERVALELPADFPSGDYRLFTGWYRIADDGTYHNYAIMGESPANSTQTAVYLRTLTLSQ